MLIPGIAAAVGLVAVAGGLAWVLLAKDSKRAVGIFASACGGVGVLLIPVAVAWVGADVSRAISEREIAAGYLRLAVEVLARPPSDEDAGDEALRRYAVTLLAEYSPVELDEATRTALRNGVVTLPDYWSMDFLSSYSEFLAGTLAEGTLPLGCSLVAVTSAPVYAEPESVTGAEPVAVLAGGVYGAVEHRVETLSWRTWHWFRIGHPDVWVRHDYITSFGAPCGGGG